MDRNKKQKRSLKKYFSFSLLWLAVSSLLSYSLGSLYDLFNPARNKPLQDRESIHSIIVFAWRGRGIGDLLLLTPALEVLCNTFHKAKITLVASTPLARTVLKTNPNIDEILIKEPFLLYKINRIFRLGRELSALHPDIFLVSTGIDPIGANLIAFFSGSPFRVGLDWRSRGFLYTHKVRVYHDSHEIERNLDLVKYLGGKTDDARPCFYLNPENIKYADKALKEHGIKSNEQLIGIHPGSSEHEKWKRWDWRKFAMFSDKVAKEYNLKPIFFLGPSEYDLADKLLSATTSRPIIMKELSLGQTAALIARCSSFLSNDSSLMHMAVALNIPTIGIFGPTSSKQFGPWGKEHKVLRADIDCPPCYYSDDRTKCDGIKCLDMISVEDVLEQISQQITERDSFFKINH